MGLELPYAAAILWSWVGVWALAAIRSFVPPDFFRVVEDFKRRQLRRWSLYYQFDVPEYSGPSHNDLYRAVHLYVGSRSLEANAESLIAERPKNASRLQFELGQNQTVTDDFRGHKIKWERRLQEKSAGEPEKSYRLVVSREVKELVPEYLDFLLEEGKKLEDNGCKRLYANLEGRYWCSTIFNPPATFDSLAMDPDTKKLLLNDLTKFLKGEKFYKAVGRAWKRGYLLYGPPGTGKSSLIAAMANFTGYDVYDLELTKVRSNTELRELLTRMKNRAIIVVEDIDCSVDFQKRGEVEEEENSGSDKKKEKSQKSEGGGITLSGLLNFTDGLWSSTGSERLFVFTTNCVEKLDAALLRPGRMDMHICMSYCSFPVFKDLAFKYLRLEEEHGLFPEIERLLKVVNMTPAQVIEALMQYESDPDLALETLVETLQGKVEQVSTSEEDATPGSGSEDGGSSE